MTVAEVCIGLTKRSNSWCFQQVHHSGHDGKYENCLCCELLRNGQSLQLFFLVLVSPAEPKQGSSHRRHHCSITYILCNTFNGRSMSIKISSNLTSEDCLNFIAIHLGLKDFRAKVMFVMLEGHENACPVWSRSFWDRELRCRIRI